MTGELEKIREEYLIVNDFSSSEAGAAVSPGVCCGMGVFKDFSGGEL